MSLTIASSYQNEPLYRSAMRHLQTGNYETGLTELGQLLDSHPDSNELLDLKSEMLLRSRMEAEAQADRPKQLRRRIQKLVIRLVILATVAGLALWTMQTYSEWIQRQWALANNRVANELQQVEMTAKFQEGQNLLVTGRTSMAQTLFQEIVQVNPGFPGLEAELKEVEKLQALEAQYLEAMGLVKRGELEQALSLLRHITVEEPDFKDTAWQVKEVEKQVSLKELFTQAEQAYQDEQWITAASAYEAVRYTEPRYQTEMINDRLANSYMEAALSSIQSDSSNLESLEIAEDYLAKALALRPQDPLIQQEFAEARRDLLENLAEGYIKKAQAALKEQADSLLALETAESYFIKALELKPNNPDIILQREMAERFLQAQADFIKGSWDPVIESLEFVYQQDPDYALGTSRQTLYEAYLARGQNAMIVGNFELALEDYQRAALLAEESPGSILRLYNARLKIADAQGASGKAENAVQVYQDVLDALNLGDEKLSEYPNLKATLNEAGKYADARNYKMAFKVFRQAAPKALVIHASEINYVVQPGDYLPMLANLYETTVSAIMSANGITSLKDLKIGDKLIIPSGKP